MMMIARSTYDSNRTRGSFTCLILLAHSACLSTCHPFPCRCGKTTLCKALAGRVPLNRMCGDVRLLCSTAEDNFQSEVELPATGSMRGAGAVRNISQMTGFVPQFDQLHESLTVGSAGRS
jgi:hypothetical protein